MRHLALGLLLASVLSGCNLTALTTSSEVIRTRIAGIRAEPAEISIGESTTLSALLVHTPSTKPNLGAIWFACLEAGSARGCLGLDFETLGGGDDDDSASGTDFEAVQFGVGDEFVYTAEGPDLDTAWAALDDDDRVEGLTVLVSVTYVERSDAELQAMLLELALARQEGDQEVLEDLGAQFQELLEEGIPAARRIVVSDKSLGNPEPTECGADTLAPNANPAVEGVTLHFDAEGRDGGFDLGPVTFVEPESEIVLRPRVPPESAQEYLYITTDLETECRQETPWYAWLTNSGSVARDYTFTADQGDLDEVPGRPKINRIAFPAREDFPDILTLWLVVRDRRGGLDWIETRFAPLDPTE